MVISVEPDAMGCGLQTQNPPTKMIDYFTTVLDQPYPTATPTPLTITFQVFSSPPSINHMYWILRLQYN